MMSIIFSLTRNHPFINPKIVQHGSLKCKHMFDLPKFKYDLTKLYNIFKKITILLVNVRAGGYLCNQKRYNIFEVRDV